MVTPRRLARSFPSASLRSDGGSELLSFAVAAAVVGALTGLAAASFRLLLTWLSDRRTGMAGWTHHHWWAAPLFVVGCSAATAVAAWLVRRVEPHAEGSGIPRVEAVVEGRTEPGRFRILPVKYAGGLLSIGAGLALGREGPSVQMGGNIAVIVAKLTRHRDTHLRLLVAGGAAAGLATAFNAPIAGGVFVLEELVKRFDPKATIATLIASAAGFASAHLLNPDGTEFHVTHLPDPQLSQSGWIALLGLLCGFAGASYNIGIMRALRIADGSRWPAEVRGALIGAGVGILALLAPTLVGGGDNLTQDALLGTGALAAVIGVFALRWVLGVVSYAACTPGGLFAPMLVLGTHLGLALGLVARHFDSGAPQPAALALIGMAAFFTASVHAPVTGIVLASEMTGTTTLLPPTLGACAIAMTLAMAMRTTGIYDLLTARAVKGAHANEGIAQP
ncbi:ClC family H(+)/Cl(-) exchange transporter [Flexivirga caeni]|uniref:ClC family H(+)/Cl(-) exchange transporter n=1 Tax=Flexivirga caeni TaxID=2294115 RepID=A0A3M9MF28_9MICO|nr:ClC family H(+)/Cl(-) exchange transporter [Flexivirga caeni]RNI23238.1 ClC family H(+)/Cl(-) exchange transporter [Flexivirga caeni]